MNVYGTFPPNVSDASRSCEPAPAKSRAFRVKAACNIVQTVSVTAKQSCRELQTLRDEVALAGARSVSAGLSETRTMCSLNIPEPGDIQRCSLHTAVAIGELD